VLLPVGVELDVDVAVEDAVALREPEADDVSL